MSDGQLSFTHARYATQWRTTLAFQVTPRLTGVFRYAHSDDLSPAPGFQENYDRSFDLHYVLAEERGWRPSLAIGLRDFGGTGLLSGEYLVASKTLPGNLDATVGLGWGRLGSHGGFTNPLGMLNEGFETRPSGTSGKGGQLDANKWFRGDAAVFGGLSWSPTESVTVRAEYSTDAYEREVAAGAIDRKSPFNFGVTWKATDTWKLSAYSLYGSELGVSASLSLDPKKPAPYRAPAPLPVRPREDAKPETDWIRDQESLSILRKSAAAALKADGLVLVALRVSKTRAEVQVENTTYPTTAQAVGRAARLMSMVLPPSVETITITPVTNGLQTSAVTIQRSDLEALEFAPQGADILGTRVAIDDALSFGRPDRSDYVAPETQFSWGLSPYLRYSLFDPDQPIRAETGLRLSARYRFSPGLSLSGSIRKEIAGNLDNSNRLSDSVLPRVRTDYVLYAREGDPALERLTFDYQFRPAENFYARNSIGYLETMFGGISGELLWKPVDSRLGLGLELSYARQRDFDMAFGLQDYDVITGHASAYYELDEGFTASVHAGRYLAGDWGATFALDRRFENGFKVGAYFTLTDVSSEEFGEGSFDKGIRMEIPLSWASGRPTRTTSSLSISPTTRDGGARLELEDRLYGQVIDRHTRAIESQWGRFWQ